jgi:hypothetical protein
MHFVGLYYTFILQCMVQKTKIYIYIYSETTEFLLIVKNK